MKKGRLLQVAQHTGPRRIYYLYLFPDGSPDRFFFCFDETHASWVSLINAFCRFATDPELNFSWDDCHEAFDEAFALRWGD